MQALGSRDRADEIAELEEQVFLERLSIYFRSLPSSLVAVFVNTAVIGYLLWTPERSALVLGWCGVTLAVSLLRLLGVLRYRRQSAGESARLARRWYKQVWIGVAVSGLVWGAAGFLLFDTENIYRQSVLAFVIAGISAGSVASLAMFFGVSVTFLVLSLSPFALRLMIEGGREASIMALVVLLYMAIMVLLVRRLNQALVSGLEVGHLHSRAEETIEQQALYDDLTGLPNRRLLRDRLTQVIARCRRQQSHAALLFLDLDHFKRVNDSLGHNVGDLLLIQVADRVRRLLREEDTAARLGGDEFVALFVDVSGDREQLASLISRRGEELRRAIEQPYRIRGNEVHISVSIGVSLLPGQSDDPDEVLGHADTAMYLAKDEGRNTLRFFVAEMQEALAERLGMERQLRAALDFNQGLQLYLQPQYDAERRICGAEALLRWQRKGEFIPPSAFIPVAEECGLIYRLGDWVLDEACRIGEELSPLVAGRPFTLAVNVSPRQFRQKNFTDRVVSAIGERSIAPRLIDLELTEGVLVEDIDDTAAKMRRLREHGLCFSIDDFGTGYSSLRYLKSLPLDTLKIDQSFVRDVLTDEGSANIVRVIITMAQTLGLGVIAEGVETEDVHEFLVRAGCPRFQGYLYSRPLPRAEFLALLEAS